MKPPAGHARLLVTAAIVALAIATAWPLILAQVHVGRQASDQLRYHEVVVREFARDLPQPDFESYLSATTPGYHLAIAAGAKLLGDGRTILQLLGSLFTIALLGLFAWTLASRAPPREALALSLPLAASLYVWPTAVWLLPDGAGWLGVLAILILALDARKATTLALAGGAILLALVFVRQSHLWAAAVLWTAAWIPRTSEDNSPTEAESPIETPPEDSTLTAEIRQLLADPASRIRAAAPTILATLPAFALIAWFAMLWGGLTPQHFTGATDDQPLHDAANPATPAYTLAVFGLLAPFFIAYFARPLRSLLTTRPAVLAGATALALFASLLPATTADMDAGRWSGVIWKIAERFPDIGHTSPVIAILAIAGAIAIAAILLALRPRGRWILLAALVAFTAAQTANYQLWQRYIEPFALIWLALACIRIAPTEQPPAESRTLKPLRWILPALLGLAFALLTAASLATSRVFPTEEYDRTVVPAIESGDDEALVRALENVRIRFRDQSP